MLGHDYALAMTSFADSDEGFARLLAALQEIDQDGIRCGTGSEDSSARAVCEPAYKTDCYQNHV